MAWCWAFIALAGRSRRTVAIWGQPGLPTTSRTALGLHKETVQNKHKVERLNYGMAPFTYITGSWLSVFNFLVAMTKYLNVRDRRFV